MYIHVCVCVYVDLTLQINWGGEVPQSLYLINNTEINKEDMELVVVGRGSSHQVEVEVDTKGTLLRWALFGAPVVQVRVFLTVDGNIYQLIMISGLVCFTKNRVIRRKLMNSQQ